MRAILRISRTALSLGLFFGLGPMACIGILGYYLIETGRTKPEDF